MTKFNRVTKWMTELMCVLGLASMTLCLLDGLGITHLGMRTLIGV